MEKFCTPTDFFTRENLQRKVLAYLSGDDFNINPHEEFKEVFTFGFSSLEDFIWEIPPSLIAEYQYHRSGLNNLQSVRHGRYVLKSDPTIRGTFCKYDKPLSLQEIRFTITLRLDNFGSDFLAIKLTICYIINLLPISKSWKQYLNQLFLPRKKFYNFDLMLEKDYLTGCLKPAIAHQTELLQKPADSQSQLRTFDETTLNDSEDGRNKGIEGACNSCYMDVLLFTLFYTTKMFDFLGNERKSDTNFAKVTRILLKEKIINPLRSQKYCSSDAVMELRSHLSEKNADIMGALMDVEELLYLLLEDTLNESEFIRYCRKDDEEDLSGDFMHLMSIDIEDISKVITVQRNLETSFMLNENLKMERVPHPAFILGLPRSAGKLVHYEAVIPNAVISIDKVMEEVTCSCGKNVQWEVHWMKNSTDTMNHNVSPVCNNCALKHYRKYNRSSTMKSANKVKIVSRKSMKLFAIICIRGVHFVTFVRSNSNNKWLFFDSMAGGSPEVSVVKQMEKWLNRLTKHADKYYQSKFGNVPDLVQRAVLDGHICIYEPIIYSPTKPAWHLSL